MHTKSVYTAAWQPTTDSNCITASVVVFTNLVTTTEADQMARENNLLDQDDAERNEHQLKVCCSPKTKIVRLVNSEC